MDSLFVAAPTCDIWSFGVTLVELVTRKDPFDGLSVQEIVLSVCSGGSPKWSSFEREVAKLSGASDITRLVNGCTMFQPEKRIAIHVVVANLKDMMLLWDEDPTFPKLRRASLPLYSLAEAVVNDLESRY